MWEGEPVNRKKKALHTKKKDSRPIREKKGREKVNERGTC